MFEEKTHNNFLIKNKKNVFDFFNMNFSKIIFYFWQNLFSVINFPSQFGWVVVVGDFDFFGGRGGNSYSNFPEIWET